MLGSPAGVFWPQESLQNRAMRLSKESLERAMQHGTPRGTVAALAFIIAEGRDSFTKAVRHSLGRKPPPKEFSREQAEKICRFMTSALLEEQTSFDSWETTVRLIMRFSFGVNVVHYLVIGNGLERYHKNNLQKFMEAVMDQLAFLSVDEWIQCAIALDAFEDDVQTGAPVKEITLGAQGF